MPAACPVSRLRLPLLPLGGVSGALGTPRPAEGAGRPCDLESGGKWPPDFLGCETSRLRSLEKGRDWDSEGKGALLLGPGWTNIRFHLRGAPARPSQGRFQAARGPARGGLAAHPAALSPGLGRCPHRNRRRAQLPGSSPEPRDVTSPGPRAAGRRVPLPAECAVTHSGVRGGSHGGRRRCDGSARRRLWFSSESIGGRRRGRPSAETGTVVADPTCGSPPVEEREASPCLAVT